MILVIYLFALLTTPTDKIICDLWTRAITQSEFKAACGTLQLEGYNVQVYTLSMSLVCSRPAGDVMNIVTVCGLNGPLDEYILRIVQPVGKHIFCMVESVNQNAPSAQEIAAQCPEAKAGEYSLEFSGIKENAAPAFACPSRNLRIGEGLYQQAPEAWSLRTEEQLTWLAGKLIWNGYVKVTCAGSGLNGYTLSADQCGMTSAQALVTQWQNQFDAEIYRSARAYSIPAKLLKKIMLTESQMWPYYDAPTGETGVMQVTDNGLDTLYRFDPALDPNYLNRDDKAKFYARAVTRDSLTCVNCNMEEAIEHIKTNMDIYARLIAAFHCRAVTINPALVGETAWRQSVVDYNGSAEYLTRIEQ